MSDSLTLRHAVVLGYLSEAELKSALERAGDPAQAIAELVTSGKLSKSQVDLARSASTAGQRTQQVSPHHSPTLVPSGAHAEKDPSHPATLVAGAGAAPEKQDAGLIGKTIGGCRIEGIVGAGGMGAVYRARHLGLDKPVAVKILPPAFAHSKEMIARFQREARAVAKLDHPHIVGVLNVGFESGLHFIVMPIVDGVSLTERLEKGALPVDEALKLARGVAEGLAEAHKNGIVHRDVKPDNVLVTTSGLAKLIDFGLAREGPVASGLTEAGQLLGTPHYMAPEQCRGETADARSDVYALGAMLYHALTGRLPHEAKSLYDLLDRILKTRATPPHEINPQIPRNVSEFVLWMMEPDRERRPATMQEVAMSLASLERGSMVSVPARPAPAGAGKRFILAGAGVAVLAAAVVLAVFGKKWFGAPAPEVGGGRAEEPALKIPPRRSGWVAPKPEFMHHVGSPPPGVKRGSLKMIVRPSGAQVWVDSIYGAQSAISGAGPCEFTNIPVGSVVIWAEAEGYELYRESSAVFETTGGMRSISLKRITAKVRVESQPPGAAVLLDGKGTGMETPCVLEDVEWGEHTVELESVGYEIEERVVIVDSPEEQTVEMVMRKRK